MSDLVVAIPYYNSGDSLWRLVKELVKTKTSKIYILDDCSTDGSIDGLNEVASVKVINGKERLGPAGNRNRILDFVANEDTILFIDSDMSVDSSAGFISGVINSFENETDIIGGLILDPDGRPMWWNYGFEMHPRKDVWFWQVLQLLQRTDLSDQHKSELLGNLRENRALYNWIEPSLGHQPDNVIDWVAEGLFAIKADVFMELGGFDENMVYHEGQDLAHRAREMGCEIRFSDLFSATHLKPVPQDPGRDKKVRAARCYFFNKHWGMTKEVFDQLYSEVGSAKF